MISTLERPIQEQTAHSDFVESLKQSVIEQTDNGRRIVRSIVTSIMEGDAPNCTPWHQLEAAKLLHKLGLGNVVNIRPPRPQAEETVTPSLPTADLMPPLPAGEGWGEGKFPSHSVSPDSSISDERKPKFNNKLIRPGPRPHRRRRIHRQVSHRDNGRRRPLHKEAGTDLRQSGCSSASASTAPHSPDAEFMLQASILPPRLPLRLRGPTRRSPAKSPKIHTPLTPEQRQRRAEQQAQQEEWDKRIDEQIEQKEARRQGVEASAVP